MSHLRRRFSGPTQTRRCEILVPMPGSPVPMKCGDRVHKGGICRDHWLDQRHAQESRRGTEAVNIQRRKRNGKPLPKDMTTSAVAVRKVTPEQEAPEPIDMRKTRQGVPQATQDSLVDRAARKRARKAGLDPDSLKPREFNRFLAVRT